MIINTSYKAKLPGGFSYPFGAEAISKLLQDKLNPANIQLNFQDYHEVWLKSYGDEIEIFDLHFMNKNREFYSEKDIKSLNKWSINISSVPSKKKHSIQTMFFEQKSTEIIQWLKNFSMPMIYCSIQIMYHKPTETLVTRTRHG